MEKEIDYRGQRIVEHNKDDVTYFLYGESGELYARRTNSVKEAKNLIDLFYRTEGGFYDAYGDLYQD